MADDDDDFAKSPIGSHLIIGANGIYQQELCHAAGGELEQIQFLLGHASVQTTERYIGCKQNLTRAVNDRLPFLGGA